MAIKKFLDCMANYSQKLSSKENRFLYFAKPGDGEKGAEPEAEKDPAKMSETDFRRKLEADTGIKIGQAEGKDERARVMFKLEDNIPRSFLYNEQEFGKELRKLLKEGNPNEVKRAVYGKLLEISKEDVKKSAESIRLEMSNNPAEKLKITSKRVKALNEALAKTIGPVATVGGPAQTAGEAHLPQATSSLAAEQSQEHKSDNYTSKGPIGKEQFFDENGKVLFEGKTFDVHHDFFEGFALIGDGNKFFFINEEGKPAFGTQRLDTATKFKNEIALVKENGKWYMMNNKGKNIFVDDKRFDNLYPLDENGTADAELDGRKFKIDRKGNEVTTPAAAPSAPTPLGGKVEKQVDARLTPITDFKAVETDRDRTVQKRQIAKINGLIQKDEAQLSKVEEQPIDAARKASIKAAIETNIASLKETLARLKKGEVLTPDGEEKLKSSTRFALDTRSAEEQAAAARPKPAPTPDKTPAPAQAEAAPGISDAEKAATEAITATAEGRAAESEGITSVTEGTTASAGAKALAEQGKTAAANPKAGTKEFPGGKRFKGDVTNNIGEITYINAGGKTVVELGQFNQTTGAIESGTRTIDGIISSGKFNKSTALEVGENSIGIGKFDSETGNIVSGKIKNEKEPGKEKIGKFDKTVEGKIIAGTYSDTQPVPCSFTGTFENDMPAKSTVKRPEGKYEVVMTRVENKPDVTRTGHFIDKKNNTYEGSWDRLFNPIGTPKLIKAAEAAPAPQGPAAPETAPKEPEIPANYLAKYNETRARERESRAKAKAALEKAGANASATIDPEVQAIINAGTQTADDSVKNLKGPYKENGKKDFIRIIGLNEERPSSGRAIFSDGFILEGEFNETTGLMIRGRVIFTDGTIYEGNFDKTEKMLTNGRVILPNGEIQEGNFDPKTRRLIKGRVIYTDGSINKGEWNADKTPKGEIQEFPAQGPKAAPESAKQAPSAPEATAEESDVVKSAEQIAEAAAKLADEAAETARKSGERETEKGEKRKTYRKNGQYVDVIVDNDGKRVEGTVVSKSNGKFQGEYDSDTQQIAFGRLTLPNGEGMFEGNFYEAPGKTIARLEKGRHAIPGKLEELGNFYRDTWAIAEGKRITTLPEGKKTEVGKFAKNGQLIEGTVSYPNGKSDSGKWDEKGNKIAKAPRTKPAEAAPKTLEQNLATAQTEGAKLEAPTGKTITLNEQQAQSIKEASAALKLELLQAGNPAEIRATLEKLAAKLATATKDTGIDKITFPEFDITWENKPKNQFGFETKGNFDKLINKVTKYKREKQGPESEEFTKFRREVKAYKDIGARVEGKEQQRLKYKEISDTDYKVDKSVYALGEDGIEEKWKYVKGHGQVDKMLTRKEGPFGLDKGQTGRFIAQVITEGSNETVTLKHIFKFATKYNEKFPKDYGDFMEKYEELGNKSNRNAAEEKEYREMFENVLSPAIDLLNAISKLEYKGEKAKEKAEELSPEQKLLRTNLYEMFQYSEREPGKWEQLIGWISGAKDEIPVMTDINGEIKYLDRGIFRRSYDPKAGYKILLETRGAYTVDEKDNRTIDQTKMLAEVNKLIRLGGMSIAMQKLMIQEKKPLEELQKDPQYKEKLKKLVPPSLGALNAPGLITKEQMEAFQLGFIISQEMKANREIENIQRAFKEENDKAPEGQKNPMIAGMLKDLEKQGVSQDDIAKIDEKLLAMGAVAFKNGKFEAAGLALNTKISVRPGLTLTVGATASKEGVTPGAALTLSLYEGENFKAGVTGELDLGGIGLGANASWENVNLLIGRAKITVMVGGRVGKELMLGVGVIITRRNVGLRIAENKANIEKETGLASPEWEAFKASQGKPVEQRYELLKKVTKLYNALVVPFEAAPFNATHEEVVYLIDSYKDKITDQAVDKIASSPWEFFHGAGLIATPYPPALMPVFVFKIGSAKVYIPNRSEIGKMRDSMSDKMMQLKLRKAVEDADKRMAESKPIERPQVQAQPQQAAEAGKEVKTDFIPADQTGEQSYSPDGRLRTRIKGKTFEFAKNLAEAEETAPVEGKEPEAEKAPKTEAEKAKDFNNKLRQTIEVQLGEEKDGRRELQVLNTHNKDVEVYIDPNMDVEELGLKVEGGKLILLGNTDNLVITRERFFMPFKSQKSEGSVKDIIVLRNKGSIKGEITREWIEKYSGAYAEKLEGEAGFTIEKGYGTAAQSNIKGEEALTAEEETALKEVSSKKAEAAKKRQEAFKTRGVEVAKTKGQIEADKKGFEKRKAERASRAAEAKEMDKSTERRHTALGAIDQAAYEAQELSDNYFSDMTDLSKDTAFQKELGLVTDNDDKIKTLIIKYAKSVDEKGQPLYPALKDIDKQGHEAELDNAMILALNEWFIPLYKKGTEGDKEIHKVLEGRIRFAERVLAKSFKESLDSINKRLPASKKITISAEDAAKKVTDKIYEKIRAKDFKFSELKWSGEDSDVEDVETDATLFSTTRKKGGKKGEGTLTKTIAYKGMISSWGKMELNHGFIKDAIKEYDINSADPEDKQIARLLLEMASPSPEQNIDTADKAEKFLRSPLAVKLASLETLMLVPELGKAKFDLISELYENIADQKKFAELFAKPEYKEALEAYKKIVQDVRDAEVEGRPYQAAFERGSDQYVLKLTMKSSIKAGAYARCANGSFSVKEDGEVQIFKTQKPGEVPPSREYPKPGEPEVPAEPIALFSESTEVVKSKQSKAILTAAITGLNKEEEKPEPEQTVHDKQAEQGAAGTVVEDKQAAQGAGLGNPAPSGTTYTVPGENKGTGLSH